MADERAVIVFWLTSVAVSTLQKKVEEERAADQARKAEFTQLKGQAMQIEAQMMERHLFSVAKSYATTLQPIHYLSIAHATEGMVAHENAHERANCFWNYCTSLITLSAT